MEHLLEIKSKIQFSRDVKMYYPEVLTDEALAFLSVLHEAFNTKRLALLEKREQQQAEFDQGILPSFNSGTKSIREGDWLIKDIPEDLQDRRVEITGPVDRKMVINALNSGAKTFMADFEDSNAPSWSNCMKGQINLRDANTRTISFFNPAKKKRYSLNENPAVLLVRPRGLHLNEQHLIIKGEQMSASLVDFGLYVFHNTKTLLANGTAPYFYLPKLEHYLEARWWNDVMTFAEDYLEVAEGTFKATVLVETITASFQLNEIIYELKEHIAGLNCGRWDYIFSYIKKFRNHAKFLVPNRDQVTMKSHFMESYSKLVIQTCHKRGIHAMGGMSAQIPIKNDPVGNAKAIEKVRLDKECEALNGHDGTWVAHPALVAVAFKEFNLHMPEANQIKKQLTITITEEDLLKVPTGTITEQGIRKNINVAILYTEAWLRGFGAVALYNLMEDAATAEISRTQVWQWLKHEAILEDGRAFTKALYEELFDDEVEKIIVSIGEERLTNTKFKEAIALMNNLITAETFTEFLTLPAYQLL